MLEENCENVNALSRKLHFWEKCYIWGQGNCWNSQNIAIHSYLLTGPWKDCLIMLMFTWDDYYYIRFQYLDVMNSIYSSSLVNFTCLVGPGILFEGYTPSITFETYFIIFQSTMNFNFVETHVFRILLDIYLSFASLVEFFGPEISVWKFWPKIPLTLCTKLWGMVEPPNFFMINRFCSQTCWFF